MESTDKSNKGKRKSTSSNNSEEMDQKAKRRAQIAKAARKHRKRQKDELAFLRSKVSDLEEEIDLLQSSEPPEQASENGWQREACEQAEIRARVDRENEFLRQTLVEQLKFTQRLQQLLTKQPLFNASPSIPMIGSAGNSMTMFDDTRPPGLLTSGANSITPMPVLNTGTTLSSEESHRQRLLKVSAEAIQAAPAAIEKGTKSFENSKETLAYMGVDVQYQLDNSQLKVYLRKFIYDIDYKKLSKVIWEASNDKSFHEQFPFIEKFEILKSIDENTSYQRQVYVLAKDDSLKAESLGVLRREVRGDSTLFAFQTVQDDPSLPKIDAVVRQDATNSMIVRPLLIDQLNTEGCELMWCINTRTTGNVILGADHITGILSRNVFENTPRWFNAMIERARSS